MADSENESAAIPWRKGALISGLGVIIGITAFVLFCHSLGLSLRDQGWGESGESWSANRGELVLSFIGFAVATILFWLGFFHVTHSRS